MSRPNTEINEPDQNIVISAVSENENQNDVIEN